MLADSMHGRRIVFAAVVLLGGCRARGPNEFSRLCTTEGLQGNGAQAAKACDRACSGGDADSCYVLGVKRRADEGGVTDYGSPSFNAFQHGCELEDSRCCLAAGGRGPAYFTALEHECLDLNRREACLVSGEGAFQAWQRFHNTDDQKLARKYFGKACALGESKACATAKVLDLE